MRGFEGSLALELDFGDLATEVTGTAARGRWGVRLAGPIRRLTGPDRYRELEARRRRAQIAARRLLDATEKES